MANEPVVKKKSSPLVALLVLVVALALFGAAFVYAGGMDYVNGLLGIAPSGTTAQKPTTPSTPATSTTEASSSVEPTPAATVSYALDPDAKKRMFYEQVASRDTMQELVDGKFASFTMGTPVTSGAECRIPVTATYKAGGAFSGTLVLRQYDNAWYFAAIARGGNSLSVKASSVAVDMGVVDTIIEDQRANQTLIADMVSGTYTGVTLGAPEGGSGTKTIPITLSGSGSAQGRIVCISKNAGGKTYWFVTSFKH